MALQATIEPRKRKKVVLLSKRQLQYIIERVKTLDVSIMRAVVVKLVDEREAVQFSYYPARQELWHSWKSLSSLFWSISLTLWTASHFKFKQLWRHIPVRRRLRTIAAPFQRYCSELEPLGRSAKRRSAVRSTLGGPRHLVYG